MYLLDAYHFIHPILNFDDTNQVHLMFIIKWKHENGDNVLCRIFFHSNFHPIEYAHFNFDQTHYISTFDETKWCAFIPLLVDCGQMTNRRRQMSNIFFITFKLPLSRGESVRRNFLSLNYTAISDNSMVNNWRFSWTQRPDECVRVCVCVWVWL